jgi:cytoskeletal protein RodZ
MAGRLQQVWPKSRTGYWRIFVKTRIQSVSFLATLAFAIICWGSTLNAQNAPSTSPDRQAQQPSSSPDATPPQSTPDTQAPSSQSPSSQTPDTTTPPPSSQTPESGAQQPPSGSASDSGAAAGTQTFSGTVMKQGDKYVLKDDSGKTYDIDHQDEVKKFEGKRVRVQGTLDPSTNKIMVK